MTTPIKRRFKIGDRVAERPKTHASFATRPESFAIVKHCRQQRYGTVIDIKTKRGRSTKATRYLIIQWDHLKSPMEHAQARICHESDFPRIMDDVCSSIAP
jgi:hypothetical protein